MSRCGGGGMAAGSGQSWGGGAGSRDENGEVAVGGTL